MLRFRGFKASFNISNTKPTNLVHYDDSPGVSLTGAYRTNKDDFFGSINYPNPPKKITPDMVTLPGVQSRQRKDISKSTSNLAQPKPNNSIQPPSSNSAQPLNETVNISKSTPNIPQVVQKTSTKTQMKEQQKLEKKRLEEQQKLEKKRVEEQKKQDKLATKEQEKAEKLRKEREKQEQKRKAEEKRKSDIEEKKKSKGKAPQPQPQTKNIQAIPEVSTRSERQQSTNTLESSISRSSGPPPYSPPDVINNKSDNSGNTSFAVDDSNSWNMVSQHRQEINRQLVVKSLPKQTHLDLQYNAGPDATNATHATNNSDA